MPFEGHGDGPLQKAPNSTSKTPNGFNGSPVCPCLVPELNATNWLAYTGCSAVLGRNIMWQSFSTTGLWTTCAGS